MAIEKLESIPNFVVASSPQELRRLMYLKNIQNSTWHKYFDIQNVDGKWYAWFFEELKSPDELEVLKRRK